MYVCAADDNQYNMMICIIVAITTKRIAEQQLEGTCEQQSARGSHRAAAFFLFVLNEKEYFELSFVIITLFGTTRRVFSFFSSFFCYFL